LYSFILAEQGESVKMPLEEVDLEVRDPNGINEHVKVAFEDIIAEPPGAHSADCVWRLSNRCFAAGRDLCYIVMTFLCAPSYALCWGCQFACITFEHIWELTPFMRVLSINCGCCKKFLTICVDCLIVPCAEACGMCCSKIQVKNVS